MIIKFYDNENYEYPLTEIKGQGLQKFKKMLKEYQKEETYNYDDFIHQIKNEEWFIREINPEIELFF